MGYSPQDIDPAARALINHKVGRLVGTPGFTRSDADDLTQDLALRAHIAAPRYDPARASTSTFYERALANKARSIVRRARADRRDRRRERPVEEAAAFVAPSSPADLAIDVSDAVAALPGPERAVARLLMNGHTTAGVTCATGLSRQRVRSARARIADRLQRVRPDR